MKSEEAITVLGDRNILLFGMSKEEREYYSEALDMAISALSTDGEYIKKEDALKATSDMAYENSVTIGELITELPTYSIPDIEKIRAEIEDIKTEIGYAFNDIEGSEKVAIVIDNVLSIIDKHIGGKDE